MNNTFFKLELNVSILLPLLVLCLPIVFYNDSKLPTYKDLTPKVPTLLTNTYPANINAYRLQEDKGTILIYDYDNESFRTVKQDDVILSQHGFVFTPKEGIEELEVNQETYIINTATGHRSLLDEILSLRIQVKNEKKSVASEVCIRYDELKEDVADYAVDAPKVFNGMVPALPDLYVIRYGSRWAGVSVPEMNKPIPLGVRVYANNVIFNFSLTESNLPYDIILEDSIIDLLIQTPDKDIAIVDKYDLAACSLVSMMETILMLM